jgi:hypothetical protein
MTDKSLWNVFFVRWVLAAILVFATYNPSPLSLLGVLASQIGTNEILELWPLKLMVVLACAASWWIFLKVLYHSLGWMTLIIGIILALGVYLAVTQIGALGYNINTAALSWVGLVCVSLLLGLGMSTSQIKMRWAGIRNVDNVEDHHSN